MFYTIDRIEGNQAVMFDESDKQINICLDVLPKNIKEGDIVKFDGEKYTVDAERTEKIKADIKARFEKLLKK